MKLAAAPLLALALALSGCSLRLEEPVPTPPPPSAAEQLRQREALRARAFAANEIADPAAARLAANATAQLEVLGGVWEPWPADEAPLDSEGEPVFPPETSDVGPFTTSRELATALRQTTAELCSDAATATTSAQLYTSMCVSRMLDLAGLNAELEASAPRFPELPATLTVWDANLIRTLDAAAWALEEHAAAIKAAGDPATEYDDEAPWRPVVDAARQLRALALGATIADGTTGTANDPRLPSYGVADMPEPAAAWLAVLDAVLRLSDTEGNQSELLDLALRAGFEAQQAGADLGPFPGMSEGFS